MKKRFLSFVLVATLLMSMIVMPANAADGVTMSLSAVGFGTENVTSKYVKETGSVTTLKPNETVAVKVTITNNTSEELSLAGYRIELNYDSSIFETTTFSWENDDEAGTSGPIALASSKNGGLTWAPITNKMDGAAAWTATESNATTIPANNSLILGYLLLKAKASVERCETAFSFVEGASQFQSESAANYITVVANTGEEITLSNVTYTPATVSIDGTDPVLSKVTVSTDKAGNDVILSSEDLPDAQDLVIAVDGTTTYTYYAHAYSAMGTDMTDRVDWTIGSNLDSNRTISDAGVITILPLAERTYSHIYATQTGTDGNVVKEVGTSKCLHIQRTSDSINNIHTIKVTRTGVEGNPPLYVPTGSNTVTATFSVEAKNIYGDEAKENIYWKVLPAEGDSPVPINYGISFDDKTLTLTVGAFANGHPGTYRIHAEGASTGVSAEFSVTVAYAPSEATKLEIDADPDSRTFAVPTANSNGDPTTQTYDLPAVTVKDQYGKIMPDANVNWTLDGKAPSGVSIKDNKLIVDSSAAANDDKFETPAAAGGNSTLKFKATAFCGSSLAGSKDAWDQVQLTLTREARTATSVTVSGGPTEALLLPVGSEETRAEPFTVVVKNQYGQEMEGQTITWSITKADGSDATGVRVENGIVTVTNDAKADVTSTDPVDYTVTVTVGGKSATTTIQIKRAQPVVKSITVASGSSTVDIPGSVRYNPSGNFNGPEDDTTMTFTAAVTDQYGDTITAPELNWSINSETDSVRISESGVLTVTSDAAQSIADSQTFTVTATSKTDPNVKGEATITVKKGGQKFSGFNLYQIEGSKETKIANGTNAHILAVTATPMTVKYQAKPCDQYGNDLAENAIPTDLTYTVKMYEPESIGGFKVLPADQYTAGDQSTPGVLTVGDTKPAAGDYSIQVSSKDVISNYPIKLMRKQDAGLTISGGDNDTSKTVTYGDTFTLTASVKKSTTGGTWGVSGIDLNILEMAGAGHNGNQLTLKALKAGKTTFTLTYEDDTYYGSVTYTVTVSPKEVTAVLVDGAKVSKIYDGTVDGGSIVRPDNISAPVQLTGVIGTDELTVTPTLTGAYSTKNVHKDATNEFSLSLTLGGAASGNYRLKASSIAIPSEITPAVISVTGVTAGSRSYELGNKNVTITGVTFSGLKNGEELTLGDMNSSSADYYISSAVMADDNAGTDKTVTVTIGLIDGPNGCNYKFETGSTTTATTTVTINKIDWTGDKADETSTKYGSSASFPLKSTLFPAGATIRFRSSTGGIFVGTASVDGTTLNYKIAANAEPGQKGTLTLEVESQNYNNYNITITVTVLDKTPQAIEAENVTMIYGDTASGYVTNLSSLKGAVSYIQTTGEGVISVDSSTGRITALKPGKASISIYAAGDENTKDANKVITVTVTKRPLTVTANNISTYVGDKQPTLTYRFDGLVNNDNVGTWELTLSVPANVKDPMKTAGEYPIIFGVHTDGTDESKYDITLVPGKLTVTNYTVIDSTPLGSDITVIPAPGGTTRISTPKAVGGATVTITVTPDKDKELKSLEVIDENGSRLPLTDLGNGRFSFVMPAGKVSVSAVYGDVNDYVNPYLDVNESDWYYEAVKYVTVNGLMNGTGASRFEPNLATSRAMIWTILARMSGVDTTGGSVWYAAAQQWAIATGVSDGTNPNGTITREQLAAMLYRYAVSKGMVTAPVTADLSIYSDAASVSAYAVEAMQWAVGTGLINGMAGRLNPQGSATRAQVATMLMRFAQLSK